MTDFDPSNPDPYKRMGWALRNYWWAIIPSLLGIVVLEELSRERWGANGKTMVQAGLLVFMLGALVYDRRVKRKKAEAERECQ
jgi:hypothetical protein